MLYNAVVNTLGALIKMDANQSIRELIYKERLKNWQVANAIGIYPSTLSVWLRTELNDDRRERVEKALEQLINNK
ncbi:hypothetical protein RCG63_04285 [Lactococcus lactis]|nr:hypothetical protein [Lactococcus lactis]MDQ7159196.1 hypothetical protein [Lactococcus lactis]